jgi:hypothetical protein
VLLCVSRSALHHLPRATRQGCTAVRFCCQRSLHLPTLMYWHEELYDSRCGLPAASSSSLQRKTELVQCTKLWMVPFTPSSAQLSLRLTAVHCCLAKSSELIHQQGLPELLVCAPSTMLARASFLSSLPWLPQAQHGTPVQYSHHCC